MRSVLGEGARVAAFAFGGGLAAPPMPATPKGRATVAEFLDEMRGRVGARMTTEKARILESLVASGEIALPMRVELADRCAELAAAMR